jgi:F-type H+-transporting ATPase subunit alpha
VAGSLRLQYAQFLELELFTRFGERPEARVQKLIERGRRLRALLAQPQFAALRVVDQTALALALNEGLFDVAPETAVKAVRQRVANALDAEAPEAVRAVAETGRLGRADRAAVLEVVRGLVSDPDRRELSG